MNKEFQGLTKSEPLISRTVVDNNHILATVNPNERMKAPVVNLSNYSII